MPSQTTATPTKVGPVKAKTAARDPAAPEPITSEMNSAICASDGWIANTGRAPSVTVKHIDLMLADGTILEAQGQSDYRSWILCDDPRNIAFWRPSAVQPPVWDGDITRLRLHDISDAVAVCGLCITEIEVDPRGDVLIRLTSKL